MYTGIDDCMYNNIDNIDNIDKIIHFGKNEYFQYKLRSFTRRKLQKRNHKRINKKKSRNRTKRQT